MMDSFGQDILCIFQIVSIAQNEPTTLDPEYLKYMLHIYRHNLT